MLFTTDDHTGHGGGQRSFIFFCARNLWVLFDTRVEAEHVTDSVSVGTGGAHRIDRTFSRPSIKDMTRFESSDIVVYCYGVETDGHLKADWHAHATLPHNAAARRPIATAQSCSHGSLPASSYLPIIPTIPMGIGNVKAQSWIMN